MPAICLSPAEIATIRYEAEEEARRHTRASRFRIEVVEWCADDSDRKSINMLMMNDEDGYPCNLDVHDLHGWTMIRQPIPLTGGLAWVYFHISEAVLGGPTRVCRVQATIDRDGLLAIRNAEGTIWQR